VLGCVLTGVTRSLEFFYSGGGRNPSTSAAGTSSGQAKKKKLLPRGRPAARACPWRGTEERAVRERGFGRPWPSDPSSSPACRFRIFPPRHGPTQENQPSGTERPGFDSLSLSQGGIAALWRFRNERIEKHQSRAQRRLCFFRSRCAPPSLSLLEIGEAGESDAMEESRERPELPG